MILLDTNVVSELMRPKPDPVVVRWLDSQPRESVWISSVTVFEIWAGIRTLESGARERSLIAGFERILAELIDARVATFDTESARCAAELMAEGKRRGRAVDMRDTMIAGIVVARRARLATRNERHFAEIRQSVVNPWKDSQMNPATDQG